MTDTVQGTTTPSDRYKLLFEQIRRELGEAYGWKSRASKMLGIAPSYVGKLAEGRVSNIGPDVIERAAERLRLPRGWFYAAADYPDHYREHQGPPCSEEDPETSAIEMLADLQDDERRRVLRYAVDRWGTL